MFKSRMWLLLPLLILTAAMPRQCATVTSERATSSDFCLIALPIMDSPRDSDLTRQQVLVHNAKFACVCEGFCPEGGSGDHKLLDPAPDNVSVFQGLMFHQVGLAMRAGRVFVPKHFPHLLDAHAVGYGDAGKGVAQVVDTEIL
jgi:hypothetical protein